MLEAKADRELCVQHGRWLCRVLGQGSTGFAAEQQCWCWSAVCSWRKKMGKACS